MTDEARLAKLTELARKAWPHLREPRVLDGSDVDGSAQIICISPFPTQLLDGSVGENPWTTHMRVPGRAVTGARALDALEAALHVLAGNREQFVPSHRFFEVSKECGAQRDRADAQEARAERAERSRDEALDRIDYLNKRHEEDLAWKQRADGAETQLALVHTLIDDGTVYDAVLAQMEKADSDDTAEWTAERILDAVRFALRGETP